MKATKIVMLVALFAFVGMTYAGVDPGPAPFSVKIHLKVAKQDRGLVNAIYQQVDPKVLLQNDQIFYAATVKYKRATFVIVAKYREWKQFFYMDLSDNPKEKGPRNPNDQPIFQSKH